MPGQNVGYMFRATPEQAANPSMYLAQAATQADFYQRNDLQQPSAPELEKAAQRDAGLRANLASATKAAAVASATIVLSGLSPTLAQWALSNPAAATEAGVISAETAAVIASGAQMPAVVSAPAAVPVLKGATQEANAAGAAARVDRRIPPSILDAQGNLLPGIGGPGTPIAMPPSADPRATAEAFARAAFNGQVPVSITPIKSGNSWNAELPDGTFVTYRVEGDASASTKSTTVTVEVNNDAVKSINNRKPAKFKFPAQP